MLLLHPLKALVQVDVVPAETDKGMSSHRYSNNRGIINNKKYGTYRLKTNCKLALVVYFYEENETPALPKDLDPAVSLVLPPILEHECLKAMDQFGTPFYQQS